MICEIGSPSETAKDHSLRQPGEKLRLSWSGLHLPGKALPLLLKALVKLPSNLNWQLDILVKVHARRSGGRLRESSVSMTDAIGMAGCKGQKQ